MYIKYVFISMFFVMDESVKKILKSQLEAIKQQRLKEWGTVSEDETKEVEYFIENYEKFCYPTKKTKDGTVLLEWEKQHKVPKVFLDFFSESEKWLYQYDLKINKISDNPIPTSQLLREDDFYVILEKEWKRSYIFEKFLFSYVLEGKISWVIKRIQSHTKLSSDDWQILSGFISYQYVRTDNFIQNIKESHEFSARVRAMHSYDTFEQFQWMIERMKKETWKDVWDARKLYDYMKSWEYDIIAPRESIIWDVLKFGNWFRPTFLSWHYEVLETNKSNFFLVSDNPFFMIPPKWWRKGVWVWLLYPPSTEKIIPINSKQCLRIWLDPKWEKWVWMSYRTINHKETNRINQYICRNATRFILSKNKEYLSQLLKNIDFIKVNDEKNCNKFHYDNGFKIQIGQQLYPL